MSTKTENLCVAKMKLDIKYERLARIANSKPKERHFFNKSKEYRRQWVRLGGTEEQRIALVGKSAK